ncbi:hypothetical protein ACOSQ2_030704 [Xanthoceras sorbifolium]
MAAASFTREQLSLSDWPSFMSRPKPMNHHSFGPKIWLLTVDGMIPFGLELVTKSNDSVQNNSGQILRVVFEIPRVIGSQGMAKLRVQAQADEPSLLRLKYITSDCRWNDPDWA